MPVLSHSNIFMTELKPPGKSPGNQQHELEKGLKSQLWRPGRTGLEFWIGQPAQGLQFEHTAKFAHC